MTLDELADHFKSKSDAPEIQRLGELLSEWKQSDATLTELAHQVERHVAATGLTEKSTSDDALQRWRQFREDVIESVGGMTMNERLYHCSLFDRFDGATRESEVAQLYEKVLANR